MGLDIVVTADGRDHIALVPVPPAAVKKAQHSDPSGSRRKSGSRNQVKVSLTSKMTWARMRSCLISNL